MQIAERVDSVLRKQLGGGFDWNRKTSLREDRPKGLSLDSLDMIELVVGLETEFAIEIPDDIICDRFTVVGDLAAWLTEQLEAKPAFTFA